MLRLYEFPKTVAHGRTEILTRPWWLDYLFDRFRWYRRFCGGHWERWYIEAVHGYVWIHRTGCYRQIDRPPAARGTPECEDHV